MTSENTTAPEGLGHIEDEKPVFDGLGVGELQDVDEQTAAAHLDEVGADARQPDDHPYDPNADPDSDYTARERADSQLPHVKPSDDGMRYQPDYPAGASAPDPQQASAALDASMPAAAPRAGG